MDTLQPGQIRQVGNYSLRNFKGYRQSREGGKGPWLFYITGFDGTSSGQAGRCSVLLANGSTESVPIDAEDRITILGRKFGRTHWNH
jgi:hypothetical protein